jgi:hypothetical protein
VAETCVNRGSIANISKPLLLLCGKIKYMGCYFAVNVVLSLLHTLKTAGISNYISTYKLKFVWTLKFSDKCVFYKFIEAYVYIYVIF